MTWLLAWLRRLVLVVLVFNFGQLLLPEGEFRRLTRMVLGLLVTLLLLQPFVSLFHQRFDLDKLRLSGEVPAYPLPTRAAAGIVEAGLTALAAAEKEETVQLIRRFCREELGLSDVRVEVKTIHGETRIVVVLASPADPRRVREAIASYCGLPATAVEVKTDG